MARTYKAVEVSAPGSLRVVERTIPEPGPGQVRIRVEACGVCHTDAGVKFGGRLRQHWPCNPGHEVVGVIDSLGEGVGDFKVGDYGLGAAVGNVGPARRVSL